MSAPLLNVERVSKAFGALQVISDVSFSVGEGECVALIGPNGAGKTTMFNLITGVNEVSDGEIHVAGRNVTHTPDWKRVRDGIGRSFQNIRLMPHLSAVENVMLGQHVRAVSWTQQLFPVGLLRNRWTDEAYAALERAELGAYADSTVYNLPYGIQKRIELVRAMLARPKLLLLDEPAAGLNPVETEKLTTLLRGLAKEGVTLLVVEHDMHFVRKLCQRVVVLNFGRKIAEGTPASVQNDPAVLEAYLGSDRSLGDGDAA